MLISAIPKDVREDGPFKKINVSTSKKRLTDNTLLAEMGVDTSPMRDFIMGFYQEQLQAGHLLSDIDKQDILAYLDMSVYKATTEYIKKLSVIDSGGGGVAGAL